jgi:thiosulfate/3-mercaptopyruvate sulfurtransferase
VLDGGLKKWIEEGKSTTSDIIKTIPSNYTVYEKKELVKNINQIDKNILENKFNVIDARSLERFEGKVPEPRKGLRSGSIKNSFCLPFSELLNQDHTFISKEKIYEKFKSTGYEVDKNIIFTCGSGVTASVLALAYSLIDNKYTPTIYDGSWSEYGKN